MTKFSRYTSFLKKAAFLSGCFFIYACENDPKVIEQWTGNKVMVEEVKNMESFFSQGGRMRAKLSAPLMLRYQADTIYVEFPKTLQVNFFDSLGRMESHLDAHYGKYFETLNRVYLRDSVLVYNVGGDTLRCPDLWWDQTSQKFYTDKNVRIHKGGHIIYGTGMEAKQDLSDINIRQASGTVMVPDSVSR
jgi:LPS export ABC transporter protein LptC